MQLPATFPRVIPVKLYRSDEERYRPPSVAILMVPATAVTGEEVIYSLKEKRFLIEVRVKIDFDGSPKRIYPENIHFEQYTDPDDGGGLRLYASKVAKEFNAPLVGQYY